MKATIEPRIGFTPSHRKEKLHRAWKILDRATGAAIVDARVYRPGATAYAAVWIYGNDIYASGTGRAGGYGYCKESAAVAEALARAGVTLSDHIDGRGLSAVREALEAVARAATGKRRFFVVECFA